MSNEAKPRAKDGLLTADHSKRGQRFVTVLDERQKRVTLLAPWEHAVLVLCDGTRSVREITTLLEAGIEGEAVTARDVTRCISYISREGLIENAPDALTAPGPTTLAGLQQAYREWHQDPEMQGRILSGLLSPPFLDNPPPYKPSLGPTVAYVDPRDRSRVAVGSTLVVDGPVQDADQSLHSVLAGTSEHHDVFPSTSVADEDLTNVADLLAAIDLELAHEDVQAAEAQVVDPMEPLGRPGSESERTHRDSLPPEAVRRAQRTVGRAIGGVANLPGVEPTATESIRSVLGRAGALTSESPASEALARDATAAGPLCVEPTNRFRHRKLSEAALTPTVVGQAPPEGGGPPILVAPPRAGAASGSESGAPASPPEEPTVSVGGAGLARSAGERVMAKVGPEPMEPSHGESSGERLALEDTLPVSGRKGESPA